MDVLGIIALCLLLIPLVLLTSGPVRIALGLALVLFFPGYALVAGLFPRRRDLEAVERIALSLGGSLAVVPLIGLGLNYTPWGIHLYSMLTSLLVFTILAAAVALYRRSTLAPEQRFEPGLSTLVSWYHSWPFQRGREKLLSLLLAACVLAALATLAYAAATPKGGERFTEFYVLDNDGRADSYPRTLELGQSGLVRLGIVNREREDMTYSVRVTVAGVEVATAGPVLLGHGEKWEEPASFRPTAAGPRQEVLLLLYRSGEQQPYRTLRLWVDVLEPARGSGE